MSIDQTPEQRIGRYRLIRPLGSGAFATVWLAVDEALDIEVAIKVLADNWSLNADVHERFLSEARLLRRIQSPRVVRVHDVGEASGRPYFVMDLIEGGTLADVIEDQTDTLAGPAERLRLGAETAFAVHELHLAGVAHRDIKPANLLLDRTASPTRVLVTDLGTAKLLEDGSGFTMTAGTPAYMAPEQVRGTNGIDARADVYAVGVVTYELLSGRRPYDVTDLMSLVDRGTERPEPIAHRLGLAAEVDQVLTASLSRDPSGRPADAQKMGTVLAGLSSSAGAAQTPDVPERIRGPERIRPAPSEWSPWLVVFLSLLVFAAAAAGTWYYLNYA